MMRLLSIVVAVALLLMTDYPAQAQESTGNIRLALTGDVERSDGHRLHYAVTVFRYVPAAAGLTIGERVRATAFIATCTLTDDSARRHVIAQRFGRTRFGEVTVAGFNATVDVGGWTLGAHLSNGIIGVHVRIDDARVRLQLDARGPVAAGAPFVPPMKTTGRIDDAAVRGDSTMAVFTQPAIAGVSGQRFFAMLQITGARGTHAIRITRLDSDATMHASMIDPDGRIRLLTRDDVEFSRRPNVANVWLIAIRPISATFSISPALTDQTFIATPRDDSFWEGAVLVQPLDPDHQVYGRGIVTVSNGNARTSVHPTP